MKTLKISDFKARCIAVLKAVARTREPVLITHRGRPLATVEPVALAQMGKVLGGLRGCVEIRGDIIRSDFDEDWDAGDR